MDALGKTYSVTEILRVWPKSDAQHARKHVSDRSLINASVVGTFVHASELLTNKREHRAVDCVIV